MSNGNISGLLGISLGNKDQKQIKEKIQANTAHDVALSAKDLFIHHMGYLDTVMACFPANAYWMNLKGEYLGCNETMAKILGLSSRTSILNKTIVDILGDNYSELANQIHQKDLAIMGKGQSCVYEEEGFDIHGQPAIYLTHKVPMRDEIGNIVGLVGLSMNITERKKLEQELKFAKEKAEVANHAKSEFLRNMRHDLRTPFTGIISVGAYLERSETNPKRKSLLQLVATSADALLNQLNEILNFLDSTDAHKPVLDLPFNPTNILENIGHVFAPTALTKKINFQVQCDASLPKEVLGDRIRTEQVLMALTSNAFKFTVQGDITIQARLVEPIEPVNYPSPQDPDTLSDSGTPFIATPVLKRWVVIEFTISDTGPGIPPERQAAVFERFGRLRPSYKESEYSGKGFGLSLVKRRVDEMEGELQLESTEGIGTIFKILIPYKLSLKD